MNYSFSIPKPLFHIHDHVHSLLVYFFLLQRKFMILVLDELTSMLEKCIKLIYSFCPKTIVLPPGIFVPPRLFAQLEIWGSKSSTFMPNFHHQEVFWHGNFRACFGVVVVFYFILKSHTYSYSVNGERALILPKLRTWTITLKQREQLV